MPRDRESIPVSLPKGLVGKIEEMVRRGEFSSKSEAIRFGARLLVMLEKRLHERSEDYAYEEVAEGLKRGKKHVSRHRHNFSPNKKG